MNVQKPLSANRVTIVRLGRYDHIDFTPPKSVQAEARRGLALRKKHGRGGLTTRQAGELGIGSGVARAVSLSRGQRQSPETIRRMHRFFHRHGKYKDRHLPNGEPSNGKIAHKLWAGEPGKRWAGKIVRRMNAVDRSK